MSRNGQGRFGTEVFDAIEEEKEVVHRFHIIGSVGFDERVIAGGCIGSVGLIKENPVLSVML